MARKSRWTLLEDAVPGAADGDDGKVLVWHVFQGAMLCRWDCVRENPFHTHWMTVWDAADWIDAKERLPDASDADEWQCVLAWHEDDGTRITGWHQFEADRKLAAWSRLPCPPEGYRELRKHR